MDRKGQNSLEDRKGLLSRKAANSLIRPVRKNDSLFVKNQLSIKHNRINQHVSQHNDVKNKLSPHNNQEKSNVSMNGTYYSTHQ